MTCKVAVKTAEFARWIHGLRGIRARARIQARIERLLAGNPGDTRPVGADVSELRIDHGPGYRVYYRQFGQRSILLLAGGDKRTQVDAIALASRLARVIQEQNDDDQTDDQSL